MMNTLQINLPNMAAALATVRFSCRHPLVKRMLWTLLAFAGVELIIMSAFWLPVHKQYDQTEQAISVTYKEAAQRQSLAATAQAVSEARKQLDSVEKKFTENWNQASLVANLADLAKQHHVTIIDQRYTQQQSEEDASLPYTKITQDLLVEGRYPELRKFIAGISRLPALNIIKSISMERTGKNALVKTWLKIDTLSGKPEAEKVDQ